MDESSVIPTQVQVVVVSSLVAVNDSGIVTGSQGSNSRHSLVLRTGRGLMESDGIRGGNLPDLLIANREECATSQANRSKDIRPLVIIYTHHMKCCKPSHKIMCVSSPGFPDNCHTSPPSPFTRLYDTERVGVWSSGQ